MALVEDPPWVKARRSRGLDFIGLSLIAIGLGCLEVMMDRGQDEDWFNSPFIKLMAVMAFLGILGAIFWLLVARRPIVHLDVFKDRNFATGCLMIAATGGILYASAVMIPQLSQQYLNYTATWSGMILSPGGFMVIVLIPIVGRMLRVTPARNLIAAGFAIMGFAMLYSSHLAANINFGALVVMRLFQTAALAFLFVPISTVAYMTLPRDLTPDGVALFAMFRNVAGSIGIALSTSNIAQRAQTHQHYLAEHGTAFNQPFNELVAHYAGSLTAMGHSAAAAQDMAMGMVYRTIRTQAAIMSYSDTFVACAIVAFLVAPFAFLMTARKSSGGPGAAH
jgi:DHA2 family multidrug resistance protein